MSTAHRIEGVEVLRAVAIVMVLFAHVRFVVGWYSSDFTALDAYLAPGVGVDLFFAISGFVITRSLLGTTPLQFWTRRAFRILPAAWLWIGLYLVACAFFNSSGAFGSFDDNVIDAAASFLQVQNVHYGYCVATTGKPCADGGVPFGIYWSLSLEEQFYLLLPLVLMLPRRYVIAILVCGAALQLVAPRGDDMAEWVRSDALLLGVLLALWSRHASHPRIKLGRTASAAAFAGLCVSLMAVASLKPYHYGVAAIISTLLVFMAVQGNVPRLPVGWLASRSYALYLCHFGAFAVTKEIWARITPTTGPSMDAPYLVTAAVLLVALAELTYRFVEQPLRHRGIALSNHLAAASCGAGDAARQSYSG